MQEVRKGMLLVLSGASGTGKGCVIRELMAHDPSLVFSVSATTRAPREGETQGVQYYFMDKAKFEELLKQDAFLEHACVHGNYYGTLKSEVNARLERGENVILDIDVQGALQIIEKTPDCVSLFLLPPSTEELRRRLTGRGTETQDVIELRLKNAEWEVRQCGRYRYNVVNDDIAACARRIAAIIEAERYNTQRYKVILGE